MRCERSCGDTWNTLFDESGEYEVRKKLASVLVVLCMAGGVIVFAGGSPAFAQSAKLPPGILHAEQVVKKYEGILPLPNVKKLTKPVPKNKIVDWVFCTLPECEPYASEPAFHSLGWIWNLIPWNPAIGPADLVRALNLALASNPRPELYRNRRRVSVDRHCRSACCCKEGRHTRAVADRGRSWHLTVLRL